jgi:hypothetical protein
MRIPPLPGQLASDRHIGFVHRFLSTKYAVLLHNSTAFRSCCVCDVDQARTIACIQCVNSYDVFASCYHLPKLSVSCTL